jgi:hypothetical protein
LAIERREYGLEREEIRFDVVDDKDARACG